MHSERSRQRVAGRYHIESFIAEGGMGSVHVAVDDPSGERIALKRLKANAWSDPRLAALFEREYHTLAGLRHPSIIRAFDYGVDERGPYYTMELLGGRDLATLAPLPAPEACRHLRDVASALALLHARRLLHRDLSPRNVRIAEDGSCKLMDFGALASFGVTGDVVGTPPLIPPEALRGEPLDQRADLYSLGALAYWLLTRQHAYPAKQVEDLLGAWARHPPAPSELRPSVPKELDALVMALIDPDPLARPSTAAEVIEKLNVIGGLPPLEDVGVAQSYLLTPALVGRERMMQQLGMHLDRAREGHGGAVSIEGDPGVGRTRLMGELALRAQVRGAVVVQVDAEAQAHVGSFGTARAVARRLFDLLPEHAIEVAQPYSAALCHLLPELRSRLDPTKGKVPDTPGEWRGVVQDALLEWLVGVARKRVLVIAVDNLQSCDASSAGWLASLAQAASGTSLLLVGTLRKHQTLAAPDALRLFQQWAHAFALEPLIGEDTLAMARSLFGDVPNLARLAERLHAVAGGNPLHLVELARHLVSHGIIRYADGTWDLPRELGPDALPEALSDIVALRLEDLGTEAAALAESLSLARGDVPLELCSALAGEVAGAELFDALDELVRQGILVSQGRTFRFAHESLRSAIRQRMSAQRTRAVHCRIGNAVLSRAGDDFHQILQAGWHLLEGGDETRGADLLASIGNDMRAMYGIDMDFGLAIPALESAVRVYRKQERSVYEIAPLLGWLAQAAFFADRRLADKYGDDALEALEHLTGLPTAVRLRPYVGGRLAVLIGLFTGWVRFAWTPRRLRRYRFGLLVELLLGAITALSGVAVSCLDVPGVERFECLAEPIAALGRRSAAAAVHSHCRSLVLLVQERLGAARGVLHDYIRHLEDPKYYRMLPDDARRMYLGGAVYALAVVECMRGGSEALSLVERLDATGSKMFKMVADQVRLFYHALRGDLDAVHLYQDRLELQAVQMGGYWQMEVWSPSSMIIFNSLVGDVIGLKRIARELERLGEEVPSLRPHARSAYAAYYEWRGDTEQAIALMEEQIAETGPYEMAGWSFMRAKLAQGYDDVGDYARAKGMCEELLEHFRDEEPLAASRAQTEMALAEALAGMGDTAAAAKRLDACLAEPAERMGPLMLSLLEMSRARVAVLASDAVGYGLHLAEARRWSRQCRHPGLYAQRQQLEAFAQERGVVPALGAVDGREHGASKDQPISTKRRTVEEQAAGALKELLRESGATVGYVFAWRGHRLELLAWDGDPEPPEGLETSLVGRIEALLRAGDTDPTSEEATETRTFGTMWTEEGKAEGNEWDWMKVVLHGRRVAESGVLGVAALRGKGELRPPSDSVLRTLTGSLEEVTTAVTTRG